jgi:hypothetical protein
MNLASISLKAFLWVSMVSLLRTISFSTSKDFPASSAAAISLSNYDCSSAAVWMKVGVSV